MAYEVAVGAAVVVAAADVVERVSAVVRDTTSAGRWFYRVLLWARRQRPGEPRLQLLYWEVLYNAFSLRNLQRLRPPALIVNTQEWTREGTADVASRHLAPADLTRVATAYGQVETYRWLFRQGYLSLFMDRVKGDDQNAMNNLAGWFALAEEALRPHAFSTRDYPQVTTAVETELKIAEPAPRKLVLARVHGAIIGGRDIEQVGFVTVASVAVALVAYRLWTVSRWVLRWLRQSRLSRP